MLAQGRPRSPAHRGGRQGPPRAPRPWPAHGRLAGGTVPQAPPAPALATQASGPRVRRPWDRQTHSPGFAPFRSPRLGQALSSPGLHRFPLVSPLSSVALVRPFFLRARFPPGSLPGLQNRAGTYLLPRRAHCLLAIFSWRGGSWRMTAAYSSWTGHLTSPTCPNLPLAQQAQTFM